MTLVGEYAWESSDSRDAFESDHPERGFGSRTAAVPTGIAIAGNRSVPDNGVRRVRAQAGAAMPFFLNSSMAAGVFLIGATPMPASTCEDLVN